MVILYILVYILVGAAASFGYKYLAIEWDIFWSEEEENFGAAMSGIFWPIVAPFTFAVMIAKHCADASVDDD